MTERYTAEMGRLVGDPTDTLVAEHLLVLHEKNRPGQPISGLMLANVMVAADDADDLDHAYRFIGRALEAGDIVLQITEQWQHVDYEYGDTFNLTLDDVTRLRLRRRDRYWQLDSEYLVPPAHVPGECMIVRAAIVQWRDEYDDDPHTDNLVEMVWQIGGLEPRFAPYHVILNALDAGAVRCEPEHDHGSQCHADGTRERWEQSPARRWFLTDWTEQR